MLAPLNQWYVAAWSNEVMREPMERWLLGEPVALYRKENGDPVALDGQCAQMIGEIVEALPRQK